MVKAKVDIPFTPYRSDPELFYVLVQSLLKADRKEDGVVCSVVW